ncbi:MAG: carbohydrate binding family 9 domain-containing protein, partial [Vicinamibacterales bacterium]|nr:carbohydrate binding family 9 domain-containing protein [Vicinamibacterales bacterium]
MIRIGAVVALVCVAAPAGAQPQTPRTVRAVRTTEPVIIDGRLAEDAWSRTEAADQFTQRDPDEGKPATERTEIRVLYDGEALYVGARMYDSEPSKIARRLSSRDESDIDADRIMVFLDPRHDLRTGVSFWVSAAAVQRDSVISNDTFQDNAWNAVWTSAVTIDDQGWSAELRIPYSQLRFNAADIQIWGVNVARFIHRKNETAWLELVPKNENGLASRMIPLVGLDGIRSARQLELAPYAAVRQEFVEPENETDPFNDGARLFGSVGLDLKTRVPGGLTLDATINPDFGQAEVDPAVVNLSAFETFYPERRRFFIEGADIFDNFGIGGTNNLSGFNTSDPSLFYSRRIGRAPQGSADGEFVDTPRETTILGAAKLSGKTARGWSVGVVEALTGREQAHVVDGLSQSKVEVEPLTNYFVARLQRDFSRGGAGFLTTSVLRNLRTPQLQDQLTSHATAFGGDAYYFFDKKKDWVVTGKMSGTYVGGSQAAIADLQQAPQRYYQRPDAPQVSFDPTRQSLSGYAGRVNLNRNEGVWRVNASLWTVSPGFESNDLGFHTLGDRAGGHVMLLWRNSTPDRWTRSRNAWIARAVVSNFNNDLQGSMWFSCGDATFLNYWQVNGCAGFSRRVTDDRLTRGGPIAASPRGNNFNFGFNTDSRKTVWFELHGSRDTDEAG